MSHSLLETDARYLQACDLFDMGEFFACHDVLEEIWSETLDENRQFLQGLIHAAVALFHFGEGNYGGARKMYDSTVAYLAPYQPAYAGLDVEKFLADFKQSFQPLLSVTGSYPQNVHWAACQLPRLKSRGAPSGMNGRDDS